MQGSWLRVFFLLLGWAQLSAAVKLCESTGTCEEAQKSCQRDVSTDCYDRINENHAQKASFEPSHDGDLGIESAKSKTYCSNVLELTDNNISDMTLEPSLEILHVSLSPKYFSVCVSWNLTASSGSYGGFVVRYANSKYCISDSSRRSMCINNLEFENPGIHTDIHVYPVPHRRDTVLDSIKRSQHVRTNMTGCADADRNIGTCGPKRYTRPVNLIVTSSECEEGKQLQVSWDPLNAHPPPSVYYVNIMYNVNTKESQKYYIVTNSTQLTLKNLSVAVNYSVYVRAYHNCSGLGDYYRTARRWLGCGFGTKWVKEEKAECVVTTSSSEAQENSTTLLPVPNSPDGRAGLFVGLPIAVAVAVVVVLVVVIACVIGVVKHIHISPLVIHPKAQKPKIFVFYSPSMCDSRLKNVQERVVCLLTEYFEVVTLNDISSGNMSLWLEETVKSAHSVLMVANKEFCCDWNRSKEDRLPLMNLLELHISSAAAQNSLGKFAFVCAEDSLQDVFVPSHSYLKLMPVFLLGRKNCDLDRLYQFVTKSRGIEFTSES